MKVERDMSGLAVELNQSSGMMATGPWTKIAKCLYSILIGYPVTINTIRDKLTYGSGSILIKVALPQSLAQGKGYKHAVSNFDEFKTAIWWSILLISLYFLKLCNYYITIPLLYYITWYVRVSWLQLSFLFHFSNSGSCVVCQCVVVGIHSRQVANPLQGQHRVTTLLTHIHAYVQFRITN